MEQRSLDSILSNDKLEGEEFTRAEADELRGGFQPLEEGGETTTETGDEASAKPAPEVETQEAKSAESEVETDDDESDPNPVPRKALISERKKRQEAQQKARELELQLAEMRGRAEGAKPQQPAQQAQQKTREEIEEEFYSNPVAYMDSMREQMRHELVQERINVTVEEMKATHEDYPEAEAAFIEAARSNPALASEMRSAANPARFAYQSGKQLLTLRKYGSDPDKMREQMEKEIREQVEREYREQGVLTAAEKASTSSVSKGKGGAGKSPVFSGPTPLSQILGRKAM